MEAGRVRLRLLPYANTLQQRHVSEIDLLVIHCTELPDLQTARLFGERVLYPESGTGNSGHYYIDRDGAIEQWVALDRVAHHVRGYNPRSIGIELVNRGRYPAWLAAQNQQMTEPYPEAQINGLLQLLDGLQHQLPGLRWIAGHSDLDEEMVAATDRPQLQVRRKLDPGPCFPWDRVRAACSLQAFEPQAFG